MKTKLILSLLCIMSFIVLTGCIEYNKADYYTYQTINVTKVQYHFDSGVLDSDYTYIFTTTEVIKFTGIKNVPTGLVKLTTENGFFVSAIKLEE